VTVSMVDVASISAADTATAEPKSVRHESNKVRKVGLPSEVNGDAVTPETGICVAALWRITGRS
jgi:hypothetical protein